MSRNGPEAPIWLPGVFQLPDDLFSVTSSAEDDLISVLLRDIQSSNFDNRIGDVPSICDFLDTDFSHEFDVYDVTHCEDKEIDASMSIAVTRAVGTNEMDTGYGDQLACQFPEVAYDETVSAKTVHNAQLDVIGHQAERDRLSVNSDEERIGRDIICTSALAEPPHGREISPPLSRPRTRRSNQRPTDLHAATHPPRPDNSKGELSSCPDFNRISIPHNADTSDMGAPSPKGTREECSGIDEHPPR